MEPPDGVQRVAEPGDRITNSTVTIKFPSFMETIRQYGILRGAVSWFWWGLFGPPKPILIHGRQFHNITFLEADDSALVKREHSWGLLVVAALLAAIPTTVLLICAIVIGDGFSRGLFIRQLLFPISIMMVMTCVSMVTMAGVFKKYFGFSTPWNWFVATACDGTMILCEYYSTLWPDLARVFWAGFVVSVAANYIAHVMHYYMAVTAVVPNMRMMGAFCSQKEAEAECKKQEAHRRHLLEMVKIAEASYKAPRKVKKEGEKENRRGLWARLNPFSRKKTEAKKGKAA